MLTQLAEEVQSLKQDLQSDLAPLVGSILEDFQRLLRQELALAKSEARQEMTVAKEAGFAFATGGLLGSVALLLLALTLVHLLAWSAPALPIFLDYAAVTLVLGIPAGLFLLKSRERLTKVQPIPRTLKSVEETTHWIGEKL